MVLTDFEKLDERMRITIPFSYDLVGTPNGARKARHLQVWEPVEIEIAEVSDIEAPVATRWIDWRQDQHETRWRNGHHACLLNDSHESSDRVNPLDMDRLVRTLQVGHYHHTRLLKGGAKPVGTAFDSAAFRNFDENLRAEALADLHRKARSIFLLDGFAWRECSEPAYEVMNLNPPGYVTPFLLDSSHFLQSSYGHDRVYRADRFADALAEAGPGATYPSEIIVFMPETIVFDDERAAMLDAASSTLKFLGDKRLFDVDDSCITAYASLRRAVREAQEGWSPVSAEKLLEAFKSVAETSNGGWEAAKYEAAAARWQLRPITDDENDCSYFEETRLTP